MRALLYSLWHSFSQLPHCFAASSARLRHLSHVAKPRICILDSLHFCPRTHMTKQLKHKNTKRTHALVPNRHCEITKCVMNSNQTDKHFEHKTVHPTPSHISQTLRNDELRVQSTSSHTTSGPPPSRGIIIHFDIMEFSLPLITFSHGRFDMSYTPSSMIRLQ